MEKEITLPTPQDESSNWTALHFGKYEGLSLPEIVFKYPSYFCWLYEEEYLRGPLKKEADDIHERATHVKLSDGSIVSLLESRPTMRSVKSHAFGSETVTTTRELCESFFDDLRNFDLSGESTETEPKGEKESEPEKKPKSGEETEE